MTVDVALATETLLVPVEPWYAAGSAGVKTAWKAWAPAVEIFLVVLATPPDTGTGAPRSVAPSRNCTEPAAAGVTVAVNVAVPPATALPTTSEVAVAAPVAAPARVQVLPLTTMSATSYAAVALCPGALVRSRSS